MGTIYVNNINPTTGSVVTTRGNVEVTGDAKIVGNLTVTGTLNAKVEDFIVNANSTVLGDANSDVTTVTSQLTASEGLTATKDIGVGHLIYHVGDTDTKIIFADDQLDITVGGAGLIQLVEGATDSIAFNPDTGDVDFKVHGSGKPNAIFMSGSDGVLHAKYGINIPDDTTIIFGKNSDATIEYDENGTDELRFAGAAVTYEQAVTFDANVTLGNANADVTTATSQLTASEGLLVSDDKKIFFGTGKDASIEYNEDNTNRLIISGSTAGIEVTGAIFQTKGNVSFAADLSVGDDLSLTSDSSVFNMGAGNDFTITHDGQVGATIAATELHIDGGANINLSASNDVRIENDLRLTSDSSVLAMGAGNDFTITHDGTTGATIAGNPLTLDSGADIVLDADGAIVIPDDIKLYFGTGKDASVEYDEDGDDELKFDGAAVAFAQAVTFDANVILGNANADVTTVTSRLTASEGALIKDDKKLFFGNSREASIEYNEDGNDRLVISGSAFGIEITGAIAQTKGAVTFGSDLNVGDDLSLTSDSSVFNMGAGNDFTITHDGTTGATIAGNPLTLDSGGDIVLDADGANILFKDGGTLIGAINNNSNVLELSASVGAGNGDLKLISGMVGDITLDAAADIILSADGGNVTMDDGTLTIFDFDVDGTALTIHDDQDTGDKFTITVAQHGATTISTTDDDAAAADITLSPDGGVIIPDDTYLYFGDGKDASIEYNENSNNRLIISGSAAGIEITGSTQFFHQVGIGMYPTKPLMVKGNAASDVVAVFQNEGDNENRYGIAIQCGADNGTGTTYYAVGYDGDGDTAGFMANIDGTFAVTDPSDRRIKENVRDTSLDGLKTVNGVKVREFELIKSGITKTGFVAQELQKVYAPAVVGKEGTTDVNNKPIMMGINYSALVPVLIKAVQELSVKVATLEKKLKKT